MKGRNELHLCEAEMIVALQEYLVKRMAAFAPIVTGVSLSDRYDGKTFIVSLSETKPGDGS